MLLLLQKLKNHPFITNLNKPTLLQKTLNSRLRILIFVNFVAFLLFLFDLIQKNGKSHTSFLGCTVTLVIIFTRIFSLKLHPEIFNSLYQILIGAYGVYLANSGYQGIQSAWTGVQIFPFFVYAITKSYWHFLIQNIVQIFCVNTSYKNLMEEAIHSTSVHTFTQNFSEIITFKVILNMVLFALAHHFLTANNNNQEKTKTKKRETDRQKTFVLSFSHELRNLINNTLGNIHLGLMENLPVKPKEFLQNAEISAELLLNLINNILDTGKVEIGELDITTRKTQTENLFRDIWGICSDIIKRKGLQGRMRIQKSIPKTLQIDNHRLKQIILNLVDNAVKFTKTGLIDVNIEWISNKDQVTEKCFEPHPYSEKENDIDEGLFEKNLALSVFDTDFLSLNLSSCSVDTHHIFNETSQTNTASNSQGILRISVSDTGCGIEEEYLKTLFQKSPETNQTPEKRKLGTRLGLFVANELCKKMNGQIKGFSRKDKGSCFIVCLPIMPSALSHNPTIKTQINENKKLKAMIVDDVSVNQSILNMFLKRLDIEAKQTAFNGLEAYQKYRESVLKGEPFDLITMDLEMPVMNGKIAIQKIRELEVKRGLQPALIIIVSGNCGKSEMHECLDMTGPIRADAFLKKPLALEELKSVVNGHFKNSI